MKILFTGSHGTGKSTSALVKAAELKEANRKLSVKVIEENVREIARASGHEINTPEFQKLCFVDHLHKELLFENMYDVLVCDRTCLDTLVYGLVYNLKLPGEYFSLAINHLNSFDEVYFCRPNNLDQGVLDDGFRDTRVEKRNEVDQEFKRVLDLWGGKYTEIFNKGEK